MGLNSEKSQRLSRKRRRRRRASEKRGWTPGRVKETRRVMLHVLFTSYVRTGPYGSLGVLGNLVASSSWTLEPTIETDCNHSSGHSRGPSVSMCKQPWAESRFVICYSDRYRMWSPFPCIPKRTNRMVLLWCCYANLVMSGFMIQMKQNRAWEEIEVGGAEVVD